MERSIYHLVTVQYNFVFVICFVFAKVVLQALCVNCLHYFIVVCHISLSSGQSDWYTVVRSIVIAESDTGQELSATDWTVRTQAECRIVAARFVATVCTLLCLVSLCSLSLCHHQFRLLTL